MKDSEILGTGNSRYLKSAIGAAATWEEVRAMLIAGTFPIDFNGINEAGFSQVGDALNKSNLLKDRTEVALFGSVADRTVDDAFYGIGNKLKLIMSDMASITLTVKSESGNALSGVLVHGIYDDSGNEMLTDSSGIVTGYVAEGSTTLSISGYADLADWSETIDVVKGSSYTKTATVTARNFLKITSSKNVKFSGNVKRVDVTAVGGGGGAGASYAARSNNSGAGGGGGGGFCTVTEAVAFESNVVYAAVVGAGGSGGSGSGSAGKDGGQSSFLGVVANGGSGGTAGSNSSGGTGGSGNGSGASGAFNKQDGIAGVNGSTYGYSSFTDVVLYGGGGGSGAASTYETFGNSAPSYGRPGGSGGLGYGGAGGTARGEQSSGAYVGNGNAGSAGYGGGGGSGGCARGSDNATNIGTAGSGGSGCVAIRMHLTAA